jgi:transposase-like protein
MKHSDFQNWLTALNKLSRGQRSVLQNLLQQPDSRDQVVKLLEAHDPPACSACGESHPYRWGRQAGLQRYRCRSCGHTYTQLSQTPLARLRLKERWLLYSQALIDGLSVRKAAKRCQINANTSFGWRHRFLALPKDSKPEQLSGIVEADETFFARSFKGQRKLPRPAHKRGHATHEVGTGSEKIPVLVMRNRQGVTTDFQLTATNTQTIEPLLKLTLASDAILCSDGAASYRLAAQHIGLTHHAVNLTAKIRVVCGAYHIQNVNAYDSRLKEWMRRFHGVATKYLQSYLGWRRFLERWGEKITPDIGLTVVLARENPFQLLRRT